MPHYASVLVKVVAILGVIQVMASQGGAGGEGGSRSPLDFETIIKKMLLFF